MNLILFEAAEIGIPLPRTDPRAVHIVDILRRREGDLFDAGIIDGPRGKGAVLSIGDCSLVFAFTGEARPAPSDPIILLFGMARPQTVRRILREMTSLGVARLDFFNAEKSEPGYSESPLWSTGEWRQHVITGAGQAFDTRLPAVSRSKDLADAVRDIPMPSLRVALDNYESPQPLGKTDFKAVPAGTPVILAFGPERGWSASERTLLRAAGFCLAHLGTRVLRTETAAIAALALVKDRIGSF